MNQPRVPASGPRVVVIGAGFGGLGVAAELLRAGVGDVTVLEQADEVGGVWRDNTYPDAACDAPSSLYSWSWAPNPDWGHRYARQPEILAYLQRTAAEAGILDRVRTGVEVTGATYDETAGTWSVRTATGEEIVADVLVPALGQLHRPVLPDLPGRDTFTGTVLDTVEVDGRSAVIPQVTGMAYRTGEHVFTIDPHDPLVPGFVLR